MEENDFLGSFAQFKLGAYLLDLRRLLCQARCEGLNFPLLLCGICLEVPSLLRNGRFLFYGCGL